MKKIIPLVLLPSPIPGHDPTIDLQPLPCGFNRQPGSGAEFGYFSLSLFFRKGIDYFITYPPLSATRSEGFNCGYAPWRKIIFNDKFSKTYERKGGFHEKRTFCLHTHSCCGGDVGLRQ
jgi:hypothetical protein